MLIGMPCNLNTSCIYFSIKISIDCPIRSEIKCVSLVRQSTVTYTTLLPLGLWSNIVKKKSIITLSHLNLDMVMVEVTNVLSEAQSLLTAYQTLRYKSSNHLLHPMPPKMLFKSWYIVVQPEQMNGEHFGDFV